jgi:hypothetical protein
MEMRGIDPCPPSAKRAHYHVSYIPLKRIWKYIYYMTEGKPKLKVEPIQTNAAQVGPCRVVAQEFFSRVAAEKEKKARDSLSSF